jgi:hypothetical protein
VETNDAQVWRGGVHWVSVGARGGVLAAPDGRIANSTTVIDHECLAQRASLRRAAHIHNHSFDAVQVCNSLKIVRRTH